MPSAHNPTRPIHGTTKVFAAFHSGRDHHWRVTNLIAERFQTPKAIQSRHREIDQCLVEFGFLADTFEGLAITSGLDVFDTVAKAVKNMLHSLLKESIIISEQDA